MTKKDYELIANQFDMAIYDVQSTEARRGVLRAFAKQLAGRLEQENPKFDRNKFLQACGIEVEPQINVSLATPQEEKLIKEHNLKNGLHYPAYVNNKGDTVNY